MKFSRFAAVLAAGAFIFGLSGAHVPGAHMSGAHAGGHSLKIGVEGAYPPFSEKTESGELIGFDIDIANALCAAMGKECTMVEQDWDGMIPALLAKKFDAIIASMSITEERKMKVDFTDKYYQTPAKFAARKGMFADDSPAALAGKRIGVQGATTHDNYASATYPDSEIVRYGTQDEVYLDLVAGRIDATLADSITISDGFLNRDAGAGFAFFGSDHTEVAYYGMGAGIAVRKQDGDLRAALNAAIKQIRSDGTYDAIAGKYFDFNVYGD